MQAEFEEKTYEGYFNKELFERADFYFVPGQVEESKLGFDALFGYPKLFLSEIFYMRRRRFELLVGLSGSDLGALGEELNREIGPISANLFMQYKRSEFMSGTTAAQRSYWKEPYFRFKLYARQQLLLEKISAKARGRALVVYAAPAFHKRGELFRFARDEQIVEKSNIVSADRLKGHKTFSFKKPGNVGYANSEPEEIESPSFETMLEEIRNREDELSFTAITKLTEEMLQSMLEVDKERRELWRLARLALLGDKFDDLFPRARGSWLESHFSLIAFSHAFDIRIAHLGTRHVELEYA